MVRAGGRQQCRARGVRHRAEWHPGIAAHGGTLYLGEAGGADEDDRVIAAPLDGGDTSPVADVVGINDLTIAVDPCSGSSCLPVVGSLFGSLG